MSSGPGHTVRAMQRLRNLSEAECYATPVSGELLRALFEDKLDAREPEAA